MPTRYRNSPIVEAVCEFKFKQDASWDATIPGLLYERIRDTFPEKEQRQTQDVRFVQGPEGVSPEVRPVEYVMFRDTDKKRIIQVAPHVLLVNRLYPYTIWEDFIEAIATALNNLLAVYNEKGVEGLTLRYLNRIAIPDSNVTLEKYLNFYPYLGENLPQTTTAFVVGCVFPFAEERDACKLQLSSAITQDNEKSAFLIELSYSLVKSDQFSISDAIPWIINAHKQIEHIFEGCITDELRQLFNGE